MKRPAAFALGAAAVVLGFLNVWRLRWVGDDAFITFRYIDNWIAGSGIVYNPGERVEGYTHFLWLCAVALLRRLGADPVVASEWLGILAATGTIAIFAIASHTLFGGGGGGARAAVDGAARPAIDEGARPVVVVPFAALILALHFDFAIWGTGGLETAAFTLLLAIAFYRIAVKPEESAPSLALTGLSLTLAAMTRPDGLIFYAVAIAFVAARTRSARRLAPFLFPLALVYLPYLGWKVAYYGDIFPNTYYAKSGNLAWWSQGFRYIWVYFRGYGSSLIFLLALPWIGVTIARERRRALDDPVQASLILAVAWTLGYLIVFVARVGGDFMYARFVIPVVPFMYFAIEVMLRRALAARGRLLTVALLVLPIVFMAQGKLARDAIYFDANGKEKSLFGPWGVTDEHWYYTHDLGSGRNMIEGYREIGRQLAVYFAGTDATIIQGGQASLAYYGRFKTCIDRYGLTDSYVAHLPIASRTRPGHEKTAPVDYLISRGVEFEFLRAPYRKEPYRLVYFQVGETTVRACLFTYDRTIMRHLRENFPKGVTSVEFEQYLDDWLRTLPSRSIEEVRRDYEDFKEFYFARNPDPERELPILARLSTTAAK